jgi:hypothetical protein
MCGIIGLYGAGTNFYTNSKKEFIYEGLIVDSVRGFDSTGIALLPRSQKDQVRIYKRDLAGYDFVQQKSAARLIEQLSNSVGIIGHNRSATTGMVNDRNAHPFKHGAITLVHNGTVRNASSLVDRKEHPDGIVVDSEYVAHALSMEDADDVLAKLEGGYSLVWFDEEDHSLHFARNDQKPMWLAFDHQDQNVYFGSESEMVVWLTARKNLQIDTPIFKTAPLNHYIIKDPTKVREIDKRPFAQGRSYQSFKAAMAAKRTGQAMPTTHNPGIKGPLSMPWQPSGTSGSSDDKEGLQPGEVQHPYDGAKLTYKQEKFHPIEAGAISQEAHAGRLDEMNKILTDSGAKNRFIVGRGLRWYAYQTTKDEPVNQSGYVIAYPVNSGIKPLFMQIFGVTKQRFDEEFKGQLICTEAVNFRKGKTPPTIVCRVQEDMQQKHFERRKSRESQKDSGGITDVGGFKEDWIEIGTVHKTHVSPEHYYSLIRGGCYNCNGPLDDDPSKIMWCGVGDTKPICDSCVNNPMIVDAIQHLQ